MITIKRVYNLAHCNVCGISAISAHIYKVILNDETGKAFSVNTFELCKPCMILLGNKLLNDSKEQI